MTQDDLVLQRVEVAPGEKWSNGSTGWCVFQLTQGRGLFTCHGPAQPVRQRDTILLPSGVKGSVAAVPQGSFSAIYFRFFPEQLAGLLSMAERLLFQRATNEPLCAKVLPPGSELASELARINGHSGSANSLEERFQLLRLVAPILKELSSSLEGARAYSRNSSERILSVLGKLSDADLQELSVEELARRCGVSRRHLNRLVHDQFGCSIFSLKEEVRMAKAAALLHDPVIKVIDVALDCGFSHLGSFTAKFKAKYGTTPGKWRQLILEKERTDGRHSSVANGKSPLLRRKLDSLRIPTRESASSRK